MNRTEEIKSVQPHLRPRANGGFLAVSPPGAPLSIGVAGRTEDEARERFEAERAEWIKLAERSAEVPR
jgi:hypothetical protein